MKEMKYVLNEIHTNLFVTCVSWAKKKRQKLLKLLGGCDLLLITLKS